MQTARFLAVAALVAFAGCGGGGGDGGGTTEPAVFTSLEVSPTSVSVVEKATQNLTVVARDQNNKAMSGLTTAFESDDESVATVSAAGVVTGVAAGTTTITVNGTVGGTTKSQTVNVTVSAPGSSATVNATTSFGFNPDNVTITANGAVTWNFGSTTHNVTFDNAAPTDGNIGNTTNGSASRTFPNPGTYPYHCTIHGGMDGQVTVQ